MGEFYSSWKNNSSVFPLHNIYYEVRKDIWDGIPSCIINIYYQRRYFSRTADVFYFIDILLSLSLNHSSFWYYFIFYFLFFTFYFLYFRIIGVKEPSFLEIFITPSMIPPSFLSKASSSIISKNIPLQGTELALRETQKTSTVKNPYLLNTNQLTSLLPLNVVLPTSSLSMVGIYRIMLLKSYQISLENNERCLPQTGNLHSSSALLSGFPRLIGE